MNAALEHPEVVRFLRDIVSSRDGAVFAIVTDSPRQALYDVLRPMQEIAEEGMSRTCHSSWRVFGRPVYLVDRDDQLRGLQLTGVWHHASPSTESLELLLSRLVKGGQCRG